MTSNLGDRTTYLGATDLAAIIGVNPYRAPIDVWMEKTGQGVPFEGNTATEWGLRLEDAICEGYEAQTGRKLIRRNELVVRPFIKFHPDRLVVGEPGVFDAKSGMDRSGYGDTGTDEVPPHVRVQGVCYAGATKREWCDIAHLGGQVWRRGLDVYRIPADQELYAALIAEGERFWREHVEANVPPPADGSESYSDYLKQKYPRETDVEMVATPEQGALIEELLLATADKGDAEKRIKAIKNRLKDVMGDAAVLLSPAGRVTWKTVEKAEYVVAAQSYREMRAYAAKGGAAEEARAA